MENIERNRYLNELISLQNNGMIKVITGMRRCGKLFLLFEIFTSYLENNGIVSDHIIKVDEKTHLMENLIYNELRVRGFNVDVGVVPVITKDKEVKQQRSQLEVDFLCNLGSKRYYIQSAWRMESDEKIKHEHALLLNVDDSFKKIIIIGEESPVIRDESGIITIGIYDFLLKDNSLEL